jgi:spore coat polysaccharide biosynthesis protein SpsF
MARRDPTRLVAIIQARMGSTRLPGKILMPLGSATVLEHVIARVRRAQLFDEVCVATTEHSADDRVAKLAASAGAVVARGSEQDVLGRYGLAAQATGATAIARITSDCPLIDPGVLSAMAGVFLGGDADLVTNARVRTFPRGLDAEIFTRDALEIMLREAHEPHQREHVTPFLYEHPQRFSIVDHRNAVDASQFRLTLDTPEDYELLQRIFATAPSEQLTLDSVVTLLRSRPDLALLNAHVQQKTAAGR